MMTRKEIEDEIDYLRRMSVNSEERALCLIGMVLLLVLTEQEAANSAILNRFDDIDERLGKIQRGQI